MQCYTERYENAILQAKLQEANNFTRDHSFRFAKTKSVSVLVPNFIFKHASLNK